MSVDRMVTTFFKEPRVVKAPKRIKPRSAKKTKADAEYEKNAAIVLARFPICQRCTWRRSQHAHHICLRSGNKPNHAIWNLLACCWICHDEIHAAPEDAYIEGWMRRKHPKPGDFHYADPGPEVRDANP